MDRSYSGGVRRRRRHDRCTPRAKRRRLVAHAMSWGCQRLEDVRENNRKMPLPFRIATGWPKTLCRARVVQHKPEQKRPPMQAHCSRSLRSFLTPSHPPPLLDNNRKRHPKTQASTHVLLAPISTLRSPHPTNPLHTSPPSLLRFLLLLLPLSTRRSVLSRHLARTQNPEAMQLTLPSMWTKRDVVILGSGRYVKRKGGRAGGGRERGWGLG